MTKTSSDYQILRFIIILFLGWKAIVTLIAFFGISFLPIKLPGEEIVLAGSATDFWGKWANWDGGHFRGIAEAGYIPFQVVFFPLYPLLIKLLIFLGLHSLWGGLLISNLAIIGALFYLYKLVSLDFDETIAKKAVFITLAFPTAFYFNAVYSESLFLFLTTGAFYYARTKRWLLAILLASLAAVTRLTGLMVIFTVALEYLLKTTKLPTIKEFWSEFLNRIASYSILLAILISIFQSIFIDNQFYMLAGLSKTVAIFLTVMAVMLLSVFIIQFFLKQLDFRKLPTIPTFFLLLSFVPFLLYCLFLYFAQGNFLAFIAHEKQWSRELTLPWVAPINYFKHLFEMNFFVVGKSAQGLIEFIFFVFFITMLIFSYIKFRLSYTIYFALSLLIPVTTGTLQAIHRYGLVIFPIFIILALIKSELYSQLWMYFSLSLLGLLLVLYVNGFWVT